MMKIDWLEVYKERIKEINGEIAKSGYRIKRLRDEKKMLESKIKELRQEG